MPVSGMKQFANSYYEKNTNILNDWLKENRVPNLMKVAEISPVFHAKLFDSIIYSQLNDYMKNKFSKYLTGFRKNHNTQNSLLRMIESWKVKLNNGSKVGVIIIDLSKAFDNLNHDLLLAKLEAYGLDSNGVSFMKS